MPIFDINPPPKWAREREEKERVEKAQKVEKVEKKEMKIKKVFTRPIIIGTVFFLVFLLSFLSVLKFSIAEKTLTKNFYPTRCEGEWQNPGNAAGLPDLSERAEFGEFSEKNSAFYSSGSQELVCKWFDETVEQKKESKTAFCGENNEKCKIKSAKLYLSFALDETREETQKENQTEKEEKTQEEIQSQISTTPINQTPSLSTSDIDTKIILWYSTDHGKIWNSFARITTLPLSNSLNNGYISFDAPFIKDWQDIENLRVMFEGVIGGEEKISAFLDGTWIEVEAVGRLEEEFSKKRRQIEKNIRLDKKAKHSCKVKDFHINPLTKGNEVTTELLLSGILSDDQIIEIGSLPFGIDVFFQKNNDYVYIPKKGEKRVFLNIVIYPNAQKGNFSIPIIYKSGDSTTLCQLNINNSD